MDANSKIKQYNNLVDDWNKGSTWVGNNDLSVIQEAKALARFKEILNDISTIYYQLKAYGIKVQALEKIKTKGDKRNV